MAASLAAPAGELIAFVPMPDRMTTSICFGGRDLKEGFVTLSQSGRLVATDLARAGLPLNAQES